jgi:hypothetical protein
VAEAFKVWLYNSSLALIDSFSCVESACGVNSVAVACLPQFKVEFGRQCASIRMLIPGPSVGDLYCAEHFVDATAMLGSNSEAARSHVQQRSAIPRSIHRELVQPKPHNHRIRAVAISADGSRGLSVSEHGTAIKLIDVDKKTVLRQFMRGLNANGVRTLATNVGLTLAACISESGTLHVFNMDSQTQGAAGGAAQSMQATVSGWIEGMAPGFVSSMKPVANAVAAYKSDRSFATFNLAPSDDEDVDYNLLAASDLSMATSDPSVTAASTLVTQESFDGLFSCVAMRPGAVNGESFLFVAQGCSGRMPGSRARCMRLSVHYPNSECKLLSTHLFPKEEL